MKCRYCGKDNTKDISIAYVGHGQELKRYTTAHCADCDMKFSYVSKMTIPEIVSSQYIVPVPEK